MRRILMVVLAVFLTGCSSSSDEQTLIAIDHFKGLESEPDLVTTTLPSGYRSVPINSLMVGSMGKMSSRSFAFIPEENLLVALVASSSSEELKLSISVEVEGEEFERESESEAQYESLVFNAEAGTTYRVNLLTGFEGGPIPEQAVELLLTEANRESLELSSEELYVELEADVSLDCEYSGQAEQNNIRYLILNPIRGIARRTNKTSYYENLSDASSYQFQVVEEYIEFPSLDRIRLDETMRFDFDNYGVKSGEIEWSMQHSRNGLCQGAGAINGRVLL